MKTTKILMLAAVLALTSIASSAFISFNKAKKINTSNNQHFAVVELFTSEGCSSCPPADEAIAKLQNDNADKPVYILAFHVDYWDRLGWKDMFSSADYSKRQKEYADYLKTSSPYTPQVVVNGQKEFVGSEVGTLHSAVKDALQKDEVAGLILSDVKADQKKATIHYQAEGNGYNSTLLLALIQKTAVIHVKSGENGGRTLSHVQIVQKLQSVALSNNKSGIENIKLPSGFNAQSWEVIGLIQNTQTGQIIGANKSEFNAERPITKSVE
jgi:hypothetical protein